MRAAHLKQKNIKHELEVRQHSANRRICGMNQFQILITLFKIKFVIPASVFMSTTHFMQNICY